MSLSLQDEHTVAAASFSGCSFVTLAKHPLVGPRYENRFARNAIQIRLCRRVPHSSFEPTAYDVVVLDRERKGITHIIRCYRIVFAFAAVRTLCN